MLACHPYFKVLLIVLSIEAALLASVAPSGVTATKWNDTFTDRLKHDLLDRYDRFARPSQPSDVTTVRMDLTVHHVHIDEAKSTMAINAFYRLEWKDEKLKWNADEYGGMKYVHVSNDEIWQPDVTLYNSANIADTYGYTYCIAYENGSVLWVPPAQLAVSCPLDLTWWPLDYQKCQFHFGSWVYAEPQLNLTAPQGQRPIEEESGSGEWKIVDIRASRVSKRYSCCPDPYPKVTYEITVKRNGPAYRAALYTPVIVSILLTLLVFWLAPNSTERLLLAAITTILISMYLIHLVQALPSLPLTTPVIVHFYSVNLLVVCVSTIVSVLTYNYLNRKVPPPPPPTFVKCLTGSAIASLLILPQTKSGINKKLADEQEGELEASLQGGKVNHQSSNTKGSDWLLVAVAFDRIIFLLYLLILIIFTIYCIL